MRTVARCCPAGLFRQPVKARIVSRAGFADDRQRHVRQQALANADRARPGATAAVRSRKGFVQVHVDDIEAHVSRAHLAEDRIEVGAVVIQQAAGVIDDSLDLGDLAFEHAERRRISQHDARGFWANSRFQRLDIDITLTVGRQFPDRAAAHDGRGRIGAVRRVRNDESRCARDRHAHDDRHESWQRR